MTKRRKFCGCHRAAENRKLQQASLDANGSDDTIRALGQSVNSYVRILATA